MTGSRRWVAAIAALALTATAAGCGRDDDEGGGGGGSGGAPEKTAGFDGKTIRVGVISPLSGPVAVIGEALTAGNQTYIDEVNAKGGVAGKYKIEVVERDSRYDPPTAVQAYNRLKGDVVSFVQILGTPIISAILPQLKKDGVTAGPATLDSAWVREKNLIPVGGPYQIQAINALAYYKQSAEGKGDKVLCAMVQDDPYGEAGVEGLEAGAKALGVKITRVAKFRQGDKDFTGQIQQLRGAKCDMVFLTALPTETGAILGTAAQTKFAPRFIGQSPTWVEALAKSPLKPFLEARYWVMAEGTDYGDTSVEGMRQLVAARKAHPPKRKVAEGDLYYTFGYNQARAVVTVLEQAVKDGDLSKEGVLKAVEAVDAIPGLGLTGDYQYGPVGERNPSRRSTVFAVDASSPFGLKAVEPNFESDAAKEFSFDEGT